ncbi:MAG TPA: cupin domain-containing protein [Propionibacteriaceae bacterium]|nr:cupin domain-containing protein [Propionibacteriaceae bacterium]
MQKSSLTALGREQLEQARASANGRSASTVFGGHEHMLRQTLIAIVGGSGLQEHASPGEATIQVLQGQVTLQAGEDSWHGSPGDFLIIPGTRHSLAASADSVVLLTVAKSRH